MSKKDEFLPPEYEDISADVEPSSAPISQAQAGLEAEPSSFDLQSFEDSEPQHKLKLDVVDIAKFSSNEFVEEGSLLTDVEEYSNQIRVEADRQARQIRLKADLALSQAEEKLAYAERTVDQAKKEAAQVVEETKATVHEIKREASEKGFSSGFSAGFEQAKVENQQLTKKVITLLAQLKDLRLALYRECESELIQQILLIAKKVVHEELRTRPEFVLNLLKGAMSLVDDQGKVRVNLHPEEYDFIFKHQAELKSYLDESQVLSIKKVNDLPASGPVIETDFAVVDLSMERQFSEIDANLKHCLAERRPLFDPHFLTDLKQPNPTQSEPHPEKTP